MTNNRQKKLLMEIYNNLDHSNFNDDLKVRIKNEIAYLNNIDKRINLPSKIKEAVYSYYELDNKVSHKYRKREYVQARQICMYLMTKYTRLSSTAIGNLFDKDHATVLHAVKVINNYLDTEKNIQNDIDNIEQILFVLPSDKIALEYQQRAYELYLRTHTICSFNSWGEMPESLKKTYLKKVYASEKKHPKEESESNND